MTSFRDYALAVALWLLALAGLLSMFILWLLVVPIALVQISFLTVWNALPSRRTAPLIPATAAIDTPSTRPSALRLVGESDVDGN